MNPTLSWQPPPVTKCGECRFQHKERCWATKDGDIVYEQNKGGLTESCTMWQQQNKEMG